MTRSGHRLYSALTDDSDDDGGRGGGEGEEDETLNASETLNGFVRVMTTDVEGRAAGREPSTSGSVTDQSDVDGAIEKYWESLSGFQWYLAVFVRRLFTGCGPQIILVLTIAVCIGLGVFAALVYPVKLNISFSSFEIPNHEAYLREDAFEVAVGHKPSTEVTSSPSRRRRASNAEVLRFRERVVPHWKIDLIFVTNDGDSIFRKDLIERVYEIERKIEAKHDYTKYCWLRSDIPPGIPFPPPIEYCMPLNTLMTYFYRWDGRAKNMSQDGNVEKAVLDAMRLAGKHYFWFVDAESKTPTKSRLLRSQIVIGTPMHTAHSWSQQHDAAKKYIVSFVPLLSRLSDR